jgi:ACS family hexuronate transporter-like MFS transporter
VKQGTFPLQLRSFATGIFNSGANVGAVLAPLSVPWIADKWGWEMAFIVIGAIGFLWLIFWIMYYAPIAEQKRMSAEEKTYVQASDAAEEIKSATPDAKVKWSSLFKYNQTWAFSVGKFLTDGVWWFCIAS